MTPQRIQRKRTKGFNLQKSNPNGLSVVYVGRPTKWGNPYKVGEKIQDVVGFNTMILSGASTRDGWFNNKPINEAQAVKLYSVWLKNQIKFKRLDIKELRGKNLSCFCPLDRPCHVDVLLKLANK